ncbi:hypothetical protein F4808DRAFT_461764 [Astrocystis sublimbata]|nr:hypothetical protein F4808DRAFT_461764 [Astrocystis sublimbata]
MTSLNARPPNMIDNWSHLLPVRRRDAFVKACNEAGPDDERLHMVLYRYFSKWKTSLMADDLKRLQALAADAKIREHVKVVWVTDEYDLFEETPPSAIVWPRLPDGQIVPGVLGVDCLKSMFATKQLRPDKLKIMDKQSQPSDPEIAARLAREILDGADLAIRKLRVRQWCTFTTTITAELSPAHQGLGAGLSLLKKARLCLDYNFQSYWADQVLLRAPALEELTISFWEPSNMSRTIFSLNASLPNLKKLRLMGAKLCEEDIMTLLSNSKQSPIGIYIHSTTLVRGSTWSELLSRISTEFPHLDWFNLAWLSEGPSRQLQVTFPGPGEVPVIGMIHRYMSELHHCLLHLGS